jgi:hypothetical protein
VIAKVASFIVVTCALKAACEEQGRQVDVIRNPDGAPDSIYFPRQEKSNGFD